MEIAVHISARGKPNAALLSLPENLPNRLGRSLVLIGDDIGVMPAHMGNRPPHASLFLTFTYQSIQEGCCKVPEGVKVDVFGNRIIGSKLGKVLREDIRIGWRCTTGIEGEEEGIGAEFEIASGTEFKL